MKRVSLIGMMLAVGALASGKTAANTIVAIVTLLIASSALASSAQAAPIVWSAVQQISGDTDVITGGVLVNATNVDGGNVTVNGTAFTGASGGTITQGNLTISIPFGLTDAGFAYQSGNAPYSGLTSQYQNVIGSGDYQDGTNTETITYTGLTVGQFYKFEFFVNDSRNCCGNAGRIETLTAGNSVTIVGYNSTGNDGGLGHFVTGTFTADSTTQTISVASSTGNIQNNGLVLRTAVPEPASCVLLGLGALGLFVVARRRRKV